MILFQPVGDEVADRADLEPVRASEIHQVVEPGHRAVVAHDLADHRAGIEAGEAGDIDRRLGMAGADEHSAGPRHQREDVTGRDQSVGPVAGVDRNRDRARAIGRADPGRDPLFRLDRDGEGGLVAATVGARHRFEAELVGPFLGQREADEAAAVPRHEIDCVGSCHLRRDHQIALVFARFVVDENEHASVARFVDDRLGSNQDLRRSALN